MGKKNIIKRNIKTSDCALLIQHCYITHSQKQQFVLFVMVIDLETTHIYANPLSSR